MQHFGTFPFDHGRLGGKVATNRHEPHAHHGEDLVIVQASHVGYDPIDARFGVYRRRRTADGRFGEACGKICGVLAWYRKAYADARQAILLGSICGQPAVFIDNLLLASGRREGLFPRLDRLIRTEEGPLAVLSTSKAFPASKALLDRFPAEIWTDGRRPIGADLSADLFVFRRELAEGEEGRDALELALAPMMPSLVTSVHPTRDAACYNTQIEFDRTFRSIQNEPAYRGKNLLFIAGLNVDVSTVDAMPFPLTKFIPWAAYVQFRDRRSFLLEQNDLVAALMKQPVENPDLMSFDDAIHRMAEAETVELPA